VIGFEIIFNKTFNVSVAGCRWEALVWYFQCIWSYCY